MRVILISECKFTNFFTLRVNLQTKFEITWNFLDLIKKPKFYSTIIMLVKQLQSANNFSKMFYCVWQSLPGRLNKGTTTKQEEKHKNLPHN